MSLAYAVVAFDDQGEVIGLYGPFDEDEAGAVCAAAIEKGAAPGSLRVLPVVGAVDSSFSRGGS